MNAAAQTTIDAAGDLRSLFTVTLTSRGRVIFSGARWHRSEAEALEAGLRIAREEFPAKRDVRVAVAA